MKTKMFLIQLLLLPFFLSVVYAQSMNKLYIPILESGLGQEISIPVYLTNDTGIVAAQFKIHFPENSIVNESSVALSDRKADHTVSIRNLGNNDYLFVIFSAKNAELRGNSGILLRVAVKIPETWAENSVHPFVFNQVILSALNGNNVLTASDAGSVKIIGEPRPDVMVQNILVSQASASPLGKLNISWQVKNTGDKITGGGWSEQVSLMNDNGEQTLLGTINYDQLLEVGAVVRRQAEFVLPQYPGLDGAAKVQVKIIPNATLGELITAQSNNIALSDGSLTIDKRLNLTIAEKSIQENNLSMLPCRLYRSGSRTAEQTFTLRTASSDRVKMPESVTIKAGQSGAVFYVNSIDNNVLNVDTTAVIYAKGIGYNEVSDSLNIIDDEIPSLKITSSKSELNEGDAFSLTVAREIVTPSALKVYLTSDYSKRFSFSQEVVIPASEKSVTVNCLVVDDAIPALTVNPVITASAFGYIKATCSVTLNDNDIPFIALNIAPGAVSESAGYQAAIGVVHRQGTTDNVITIKLTDNSNGALYYASSTITLEKGVSEKQFTVGVVDNAIVDGNRDVAVTAAVYISACSCSASGAGAGVVQSKLSILDDDGPSLKISSSQNMLPEGKSQATLLTISRNTSTAQALTVNISSNPADKLMYETTVIIPAGSTSLTVPVAVKNNDVAEGNQPVTFTASSEGFTDGVCWAIITDQTLADATVSILSISPNNPFAKGTLLSEILVSNSGVAKLASHTSVDIYLCNTQSLSASSTKQLLTTLYTSKEIIAQNSESLIMVITLPDLTGQYYIVAQVNAGQSQKELSYLNNTSEASSLVLMPRYKVLVSTDKKVYKPGDIVLLSGNAVAQGSSTISGDAVEVYVIDNGYRESLKATTDAAGAFQVSYTPYSGQMGHFIAGACYPNEALTNEQTSFDIYSLKRTSSDIIKWDVLTNVPITGEIELVNPGNFILTGLKTTLKSIAKDWQLTFDPISDLKAGEKIKLKYTLTGLTESNLTSYEQIKFQVTSFEGASLNLTAYYVCHSPKANLKANLLSIQTTMTKGAMRTYQFTLTNNGKGATGKISLNIPSTSWLTLDSPFEMPSLAYGESSTVVLRLSPDNDMTAHTYVTGTIGINCENGSGLSLPFNIETVSEKKGALTVDVCDEYTYFTSEAPHLANAKVVVKHPYTGVIVSQGTTDNHGLFNVENLSEGYYTIVVTADKHDSYTNNILVDPGKITKTTVNLSFQAITYTWNVQETTVQDTYTTETVVKYETNVPTPVVVVKFPDELPLKNQIFKIYVTNKGLINANDVTINMPLLKGVKFEALTDNPITVLPPQQSLVFTVKMIVEDENVLFYSGKSSQTRSSVGGEDDLLNSDSIINSASSFRFKSNSASPVAKAIQSCIPFDLSVDWSWLCGGDAKSAGSGKSYNSGSCPSSSGGGGLWPRYTLYGNNGRGLTPTMVEAGSCHPCAKEIVSRVTDCAIGFIPYFGCFYGSSQCIKKTFYENAKMNIYQETNCALTAIGCGSEAIPLWGNAVGIPASVISCIVSFLEPCGGQTQKAAALTSALGVDTEPSYFTDFRTKIKFGYDELIAINGIRTEIVKKESWLNCSSSEWNKFYSYLLSHKLENGIVLDEDLKLYKPISISDTDLEWFVERWNNTLKKEKGLEVEGDNYVNLEVINEYIKTILSSEQKAVTFGYDSMGDLMTSEFNKLNKNLNETSNSVCASISLQFSQTMIMTRQAFRGTLSVYNGHETAAMQNVKLNLVVKDSEGNIAGSQLFQMNTESIDKLTAIDGTGTLPAQETGIATILFIPTKYAAPTISKIYTFGGELSYLDPFTGTVITRNLYPVTLTVKPSPDLKLSYFMQRDILGDDALTKDVVEPIEPAEFSLLINNVGAGDATSVNFSSSQPQIIKNEKGLLVDFKMIGSSLNGAEKSAEFSNVDFGNIFSGKTSYAQWWFTSSLLGHFIEYDTKVTHVTSYGNPDLSLVSDISVHELIRSMNVPTISGAALTGFLANDIPDADDLPDMLYLSDGNNEEVNIVSDAAGSKISDIAYSLVVTPSKIGWNYGVISDPGNGRLKLIGVTRQRDNATISLRNFWQTNRTLRDAKDPLYENRIHFADNFASGNETYLLAFETKPDNVLKVEAITGIPEDFTTTQLVKVNIRFNKPIVASTFTIEDITLNCQGKSIDISKLAITAVSSSEYAIDLSTVTVGNGYYVLTVQTTKITDEGGYQGETGKSAGWTQYLTGDVQIAVQILPKGSGSVNPSSGGFAYGTLSSFFATPATAYSFKNWTLEGQILSSETKLNYLATENKTLVANFEAKNCKVNIQCDLTQGTVSGGTTGIYVFGSELTVTAEPAINYTFKYWSVGGIQVSTSTTYTLPVDGDKDLVANFAVKTFTANVASNDTNKGTVSGGGVFNYNQSVTVMATVKDGYGFNNWTENSVEVSKNANYTFNILADRNLIANFQIIAGNGTQFVNTSMSVYPNPSQQGNGVHLALNLVDESLRNGQLVITTLLGTIVKVVKLTEKEMVVSNIGKGLFIFDLQVNNVSIEHRKVIIQ